MLGKMEFVFLGQQQAQQQDRGKKMRYEVDPVTFAISFYNEFQIEPYQYQPHYPNGDSFDSLEEASTWAEASIAAHDPAVEFFAPSGKGLDPEKKPDLNARQTLMNRLGITEEELALLRL
jgi:hypothetical protein